MANRYLRSTTLHVEGRDDLYAIADLLRAHGFHMDDKPRDVEIDAAALDERGQGRGKLLGLIETAVKASTGSAVGFVIDADTSASATWDSVRHHVETATGGKSKLPKNCPPEGVVADISEFKSRVGIWIMPDNSSDGILEDFLQQLIAAADRLLPIAKTSTDRAKAAGAAFSDAAKPKAVVHAWLAWQADPGCPFGTAIKARYFNSEAPSAKRFVDWVRRLVD